MHFIIRLIHQLTEEQRGTALVMIALCLAVLLSSAALVTDVGILYLARAELVNCVDAAALAGGQDLIIDRDTARSTASSYAIQNSAISGEPGVDFDEAGHEITVTGRRTVNLFLARVLGQETGKVSASATARIGSITGVSGAAPLSVGNQEFVYGERYYLKESPNGSGDPYHYNGWYRALSLGGGGADKYLENLKNGYSGTLNVGDVVNTESGNMSGPTKNGINYRLAACLHSPQCTFSSFERDCPRVMVVPIVDPYDWDGGQIDRVVIVGFAAFFLEESPRTGNDNQIVGRFVRTVSNGTFSAGGNNFGLYGVELVH